MQKNNDVILSKKKLFHICRSQNNLGYFAYLKDENSNKVFTLLNTGIIYTRLFVLLMRIAKNRYGLNHASSDAANFRMNSFLIFERDESTKKVTVFKAE